jgi:hypothetical protein
MHLFMPACLHSFILYPTSTLHGTFFNLVVLRTFLQEEAKKSLQEIIIRRHNATLTEVDQLQESPSAPMISSEKQHEDE